MTQKDENGIAIFVRDLSLPMARQWAIDVLGQPLSEAEAGDALVYDTGRVRLVVTPNIEGGCFTELWLIAGELPWPDAAAFARSTARAFGREVLFEPPGDHNPYVWVSVAPDGAERVTEWVEGPEPASNTSERSNERGCYCGLWESNPEVFEREGLTRGWCGRCGVCGSPGHTRHAPDGPYTAAWCDRCYRRRSYRTIGVVGMIVFGIVAFIGLKTCT